MWLSFISRLSCAFVFALGIVRPQPAAATSRVDFDEIDAYVRSEMARAPIPGLALGVVHGSEIAHLKGFGTADPSGRLVTPQTSFILGSVSKTFTALAVQQLAEAGSIDLDTPVQQYLPWFRVADDKPSKQIHVRHLLEHTSGIPASAGQTADLLNTRYSLEEIVRNLATVQLDRPVGTSVEYSNLNYLVLGLIIEAASGIPYADYVQAHIFAPLNMQYSYTSQDEAQLNGLATGHRVQFGFAVPDPMPYLSEQISEGYLISSAEDMAHYLIAYLNRGRYDDTALLKPDHHAVPVPDGWFDEYWNVRSESPANVRVGHSGGTNDFSAQFWLLPGSQWGVIVLMNAQPDAIIASSVSATSIATGVAMLLQGWAPGTPEGLGFWATYALVDTALLVLFVFAVIEVITLPAWRRGLGSKWPSMVLDLAVSLGIFIGLPLLFGRAWDFWLIILPDIAGTLRNSALILLAVSTVKALSAYYGASERNHAPIARHAG